MASREEVDSFVRMCRHSDDEALHFAADEIERLRAVLDSRLRVALDNRQALDDLVAAESKVRSLQAEIERLRALVHRVAQLDPRCTDDCEYATCAFCYGGQLERDEQPEPGNVVTDHYDESAFVLRFVCIEHEPDCVWLACRQESPC